MTLNAAHLAKFSLYQQLAQIVSGDSATFWESLGILAQPSSPVISQRDYTDQPKLPAADSVFDEQQLLPLKGPLQPQAVRVKSDAGDTITRQADQRSPAGQLNQSKSPAIVATLKPLAKPLIPGGPCENPVSIFGIRREY